MALFGFGKKKEEKASVCCCGSAPEQKEESACTSNSAESIQQASPACCCGGEPCGITNVKVLGAGCKNCHEQYENCKAAVKELGMSLEVEYITDMEKVMAYGVMSMPGIVINDRVVSMGKVLKSSDVIKLLKKLGYC